MDSQATSHHVYADTSLELLRPLQSNSTFAQHLTSAIGAPPKMKLPPLTTGGSSYLRLALVKVIQIKGIYEVAESRHPSHFLITNLPALNFGSTLFFTFTNGLAGLPV